MLQNLMPTSWEKSKELQHDRKYDLFPLSSAEAPSVEKWRENG